MKNFRIKIPPDNNKKEKYFSELLYALHETLDYEQVSFELVTDKQSTSFCFSCEDQNASLIAGQIYSQFPDSDIEEITDPINNEMPHFIGAEVFIKKSDLFPIKIYEEFESDSLVGLLSVLAKATINERIVIQFVIKPKKDTGGLHFSRGLKRKLETIRHFFRFKYWFKKGDFRQKFKEAFIKKENERLFETSVRFIIYGPADLSLSNRFHSIKNAFYQFNSTDLNQFRVSAPKSSESYLNMLKNRKFHGSYLFSQSEIATLFHLPNEREVPNLVYVLSRRSDAPPNLPTSTNNPDISFFGTTNFHNNQVPFGIFRNDRRRHLYTVGKSGSGKSKMIELLVQNDILNGRGVGVLDPHGDLVDNILKMIPEHRIKDVIVFDPADENFPIAFNPLEKVPSYLKMRVTIGFLEIFKKLFGTNWTDRLEHVLRYTVLALLDSPNTTVLSILKMLSDKNYRQYIVRNIEDDVVKNFWVNEFAGWSEKFDAEAITPLLNKVGQFVATNMIRNIVGQPTNKLNIREIMDNGKILLMKVSKGMLGEENAGLMGAIAVTKIYQAAMSRADTPEENRRDFYFYVDEFHNFATNTFDEILSEARKYRLNLTLAHQFMGQLSDSMKKTVFGNVGSMVSFRVGAEDAAILAGEYDPVFSAKDIINLGVRDFYCKMSVNGETTKAFSARTLDMIFPKKNFKDECINYSRQQYCMPIAEAEKIISQWEEGVTAEGAAPHDIKKATANKFEEINFDAPII